MAKQFRKPVGVADRKARFAALNQFVTERHDWLTSIPGAIDLTMECLPGSSLPDELRKLGHDVEPAGEGKRVLSGAIVERFIAGADGEMVPLTAGSSRAVALTVTHAGICKVMRYAFDMP